MKPTRFFAAAVLLLSVLSCQKEEQKTPGISENEGRTLITCTFAANDATTKTTLGGMTPKWAANDEIMLYDGSSNTQTLTLATSGTASSSKGIINGEDDTKFTFVKPDGWENVYAIYPSSACVSGFSANAPKINFAGQNGTFAKANICAAAESSGIMSFKNVAAIFKFPSKPATVTELEIQLAGLANDYTVSFSGTNPSLASAAASNSRSYSIGTETGEIYIAVPGEETIAQNTVFIYRGSSSNILGSYLIKTAPSNPTASNKIYTLPAIVANGMLPGLFTVDSEGNQVRFSKGNLQATVDASGAPTEWNFADNQYGYIGNAVANNSIGKTAGVVDLFGWSTSKPPYGISTSTTNSDYSGDFVDWGNNPIANGGNTANLWKTLTKDEWAYLLSTRSVNGKGEGKSYKRTTLTLSDNTTTIYGLIIAPDNYTGSLSTYTTTSWSNWQTMETAGCVFLPAAGRRQGSIMSNTGRGNYWSATLKDTQYAYQLYFYNYQFSPSADNSSYFGYSVRLVCDAQ